MLNNTSTLAEQLKAAPIAEFKAKDIFRSSQVSLLGISNLHVEKDKKKSKKALPSHQLYL